MVLLPSCGTPINPYRDALREDLERCAGQRCPGLRGYRTEAFAYAALAAVLPGMEHVIGKLEQ